MGASIFAYKNDLGAIIGNFDIWLKGEDSIRHMFHMRWLVFLKLASGSM
jgi:hypothetical protein